MSEPALLQKVASQPQVGFDPAASVFDMTSSPLVGTDHGLQIYGQLEQIYPLLGKSKDPAANAKLEAKYTKLQANMARYSKWSGDRNENLFQHEPEVKAFKARKNQEDFARSASRMFTEDDSAFKGRLSQAGLMDRYALENSFKQDGEKFREDFSVDLALKDFGYSQRMINSGAAEQAARPRINAGPDESTHDAFRRWSLEKTNEFDRRREVTDAAKETALKMYYQNIQGGENSFQQLLSRNKLNLSNEELTGAQRVYNHINEQITKDYSTLKPAVQKAFNTIDAAEDRPLTFEGAGQFKSMEDAARGLGKIPMKDFDKLTQMMTQTAEVHGLDVDGIMNKLGKNFTRPLHGLVRDIARPANIRTAKDALKTAKSLKPRGGKDDRFYAVETVDKDGNVVGYDLVPRLYGGADLSEVIFNKDNVFTPDEVERGINARRKRAAGDDADTSKVMRTKEELARAVKGFAQQGRGQEYASKFYNWRDTVASIKSDNWFMEDWVNGTLGSIPEMTAYATGLPGMLMVARAQYERNMAQIRERVDPKDWDNQKAAAGYGALLYASLGRAQLTMITKKLPGVDSVFGKFLTVWAGETAAEIGQGASLAATMEIYGALDDDIKDFDIFGEDGEMERMVKSAPRLAFAMLPFAVVAAGGRAAQKYVNKRKFGEMLKDVDAMDALMVSRERQKELREMPILEAMDNIHEHAAEMLAAIKEDLEIGQDSVEFGEGSELQQGDFTGGFDTSGININANPDGTFTVSNGEQSIQAKSPEQAAEIAKSLQPDEKPPNKVDREIEEKLSVEEQVAEIDAELDQTARDAELGASIEELESQDYLDADEELELQHLKTEENRIADLQAERRMLTGEAKAPTKSDQYDAAQEEIDDMFDAIEAEGKVDPFKFYDDAVLPNGEPNSLVGHDGWTEMPKELKDLYAKRDAIGASMLQENIDDLTTALDGVGITGKEAKRVLENFSIDPEKTDSADQYFASEYTMKKANRDPNELAESVAYSLAAERNEMFDELKDVSPKTLEDAAKAVQAIRIALGIEANPNALTAPAAESPKSIDRPRKEADETTMQMALIPGTARIPAGQSKKNRKSGAPPVADTSLGFITNSADAVYRFRKLFFGRKIGTKDLNAVAETGAVELESAVSSFTELGNTLNRSINKVASKEAGFFSKVRRQEIQADVYDALHGDDKAMKKLSPSIAKHVETGRKNIDFISRELIKSNNISPAVAKAIGKNIGKYIFRQFRAHTPGSGWNYDYVKENEDAVYQDALKYISNTKGISTDAADNIIREMLDSANTSTNGFLGGSSIGKGDVTSFIKKQDLDPEILKLLGEIKDPTTLLRDTGVKGAKLVINYKMQNEFAEALIDMGLASRMVNAKGRFFKKNMMGGYLADLTVKDPKTGKDKVIQVWRVDRKMAGFGRLYMTPESKTEMDAFFAPVNETKTGALSVVEWGTRQLAKVVSIGKYNQVVLSPQAYMTNLFGGAGFEIAAGRISAFNNDGAKAYAKILTKDARAKGPIGGRDNPYTLMEQAENNNKLVKDHDTSKMRMEEIEGEMRRYNLLNNSVMAGDALAAVETGYGKEGLIAKKMRQGATFYQASDNAAKATAFVHEINKWKKALPAINPDTGKPTTMREVFARAGRDTRMTTQNYDMVLPFLKQLSQRGIIVPSYVSFTSEMIRNTKNNIVLGWEETASGNPVLMANAVKRAAGMTALGVITHQLSTTISEMMSGYDDEEREAMRESFAPWNEFKSLVFTGENEKGHVGMFDPQYLIPQSYFYDAAAMIMRPGDAETKAKRALGAAIGPFRDLNILTQLAVDMVQGEKESGKPLYNKETDTQEAIWDARFSHIYESMFEPGLMKMIKNQEKANKGGVAYAGVVRNPDDNLKRIFGVRPINIDMKSDEFAQATLGKYNYTSRDINLETTKAKLAKLSKKDVATKMKEKDIAQMNQKRLFDRSVKVLKYQGWTDAEIYAATAVNKVPNFLKAEVAGLLEKYKHLGPAKE
tara:strand:- start:24045 stop:30029 length:5985 start_codon:yes stop_codon:yes gene_type:complete